MNDKEASALLRDIVRLSPNMDANQALAWLDTLERNWLDTQAQRDEDNHPSLVKVISLAPPPSRATRVVFGESNVRGVKRLQVVMDAASHYPAMLTLTVIDESALTRSPDALGVAGGWRTPPLAETEIPLQSFVFRGVRG